MIEGALRHDRAIVIAGLTLVIVAAWGWTLGTALRPLDGGGAIPGMGDMIGVTAAWSLSHAVLMFFMWWVMMVAMMMPSAAPFVLLATGIHRHRGARGRPVLVAALLTAGYLAVWATFSLVATLGQWGLESAGLLSATIMTTGPAVGGVILLGAGLYQLAPIKRACLEHCRSPVAFLARHWRTGAAGAVRMGMLHGVVCVGCCWFLMALLFVGGVMNPIWIGGIALYVLIEKLAPWGERLRRAAALLLIASALMLWGGLI